LEDVIRHHLSPREAIENYDLSQLPPGIQTDNFYANSLAALEQLERLQLSGDSLLTANTFSDTQVDRLVSFLIALTDPCVLDRLCLAKWIPDSSTPDPDGLRVHPINDSGDPL
jgi:cytochrome c peroxidase